MAVELNDVLKLVGFEIPTEGDYTIEDVRGTVESHFIAKDEIENRKDILEPIISKHIGQHLGAAQTALISEANKAGLKFTHNDFKDKKLIEILPTIFAGVSEAMAGAKKPDDKLSAEIERWKGEYNELKTGYETLQSEKTSLLSDFEQKEKSWAINHVIQEDWKKVKLDPNVDNYKRRGFEVEFNEKYSLEKAEDGIWPVYRDGEKKGSRVKSADSMTKHLTHEQLLVSELEKAGMLAKAHQNKVVRPNVAQQRGGGDGNGQSKIPVHPAFAGRG